MRYGLGPRFAVVLWGQKGGGRLSGDDEAKRYTDTSLRALKELDRPKNRRGTICEIWKLKL